MKKMYDYLLNVVPCSFDAQFEAGHLSSLDMRDDYMYSVTVLASKLLAREVIREREFAAYSVVLLDEDGLANEVVCIDCNSNIGNFVRC